MIKVNVKFSGMNMTKRTLKKAHQEVKRARAAAIDRALAATITESSRTIASEFRVQTWQVMGQGSASKSIGGRLGKTKRTKDGGSGGVYVRHTHMNPVGTMGKAKRRVTNLKEMKGGRVRAGKHTFNDAWIVFGPHGRYIRTRTAGGTEVAKIEMGDRAPALVRLAMRTRGVETFKNRFDHELGRRLKKIGAR